MTTTPSPSTAPTTTDPALRERLLALMDCGLRMAQVTAEMAEVEGRVLRLVAAGLPAGLPAGSLEEAQQAGCAVDAADLALRQAAPRMASLGATLERVSRAGRRTAALLQRIECGWPRRSVSDDRRAMARRQVARAVGERIARDTDAHTDAGADAEAAERLFDDLSERLDTLELDGGLLDRPVEVVIAAICRDLGLPEPQPDMPNPGVPPLETPQPNTPQPNTPQRGTPQRGAPQPGALRPSGSATPPRAPPDGRVPDG